MSKAAGPAQAQVARFRKSTCLSVSGLAVDYGTTRIIFDLDFAVEAGQVTIVVGPNGCGKSTLLKAMARILRPAKGAVLLDREPVHHQPTRKIARRIALLPQGPVAPEGLTVRELVSQGRFPHQSLIRQWSREDARAVAEAMAAADVTEFADRRVSDLSGGQRQRCWIAMVLAQETEILLLDEPTTFLDLKVQVELMQLLHGIAHGAGRTLVIVMHELNVAAAFADRLVMMKDGAIVAEGPVREVFTTGNLSRIFGLDAVVLMDPESGRPVCVPRTDLARPVAAQ
ncbi:ABC transporter ATP-binding protein [Aestuariibius sp. 2305UL40-4]|uniref:ABC transporter ATP-binding protein n=1 Tax=Aestuariibius violaceus TaxID=3234132 RepID=UPI00345E9196